MNHTSQCHDVDAISSASDVVVGETRAIRNMGVIFYVQRALSPIHPQKKSSCLQNSKTNPIVTSFSNFDGEST